MITVMVMDYTTMPIGEILEDLAMRVRSERLNRNLTQRQLAHDVGVSVDTIRNLESRGNATLAVFVKVLRGLELDGRLALLMPAPTASPIQVAQRRGHARERASGSRVSSTTTEWEFEDAPDGAPPVVR